MTDTLSAIDLTIAPCRSVRFGEVGVDIERRPDGVVIVSGKAPLKPYDRCCRANANLSPLRAA